MYKVGFILNGRSRKKRSFYKQLKEARKSFGNLEFNVIETSQPGHASSLATEFIKDGYSHIIAVGGDGTLNEALNGYMIKYNESIVLGSLPSGTANDFLKTTQGPLTVPDLFEAIVDDEHEFIDIGALHHEGGIRYFINIADLGIGADVVQKVNKSRRLLGAHMTFFSAILQTFATYRNKEIVCKTDSWSHEGKVNSLVIANGRYFGSGMAIAPDATITDGKFQVVVIGDISLGDYLKNVGRIKKGEKVNHPEVKYLEATSLEVKGDSCGFEADGEMIGNLPLKVEMLSKKVRFLTGQKHP